MHKKYPSMTIILFIYVLATLLGIFIYKQLSFPSMMLNVFLANVLATCFIWIVGLLLKNASLYDPYWSVQPPVIFILLMNVYQASWTTLNTLLFLGIMVWSIRLTLNWAKSWIGFQEQDWRYTMIKSRAPKLYLVSNLFGIHLMPTAIVFIQLLTLEKLLVLSSNPNIVVFIGFGIMILSALIQYLSDEQMRRFKEKTKGEKRCIDEGLWKYSRHPNYFGEIMVWWGLYIMYVGTVQTLDLQILSPILMTLLFVFISIPMMEKRIVQSRPEYEDYKERVSMLIPFFRKDDTKQMKEES
jgi:steroid 5-alpha reductase family enzyme